MSSSNLQNTASARDPSIAMLKEWRSQDYQLRRIEQIARENGEKDGDDLMRLTHSIAMGLMIGYVQASDPVEELARQIHQLWSIYYVVARFMPFESAAQERFLFRIVQLQQRGIAHKPRNEIGVANLAKTSDGYVWADLPYLATDMMKYWNRDGGQMSAAQRRNFSGFLARLVSCGVCQDRLMNFGITIFHDTLEKPRALSDIDPDMVEDSDRSLADLTIADLLPVLLVWLTEAGSKIVQLSEDSCSEDPVEEVQTRGSDSDHAPASNAGGLSPARLISWLKRLGEIAEEADAAGKTDLKTLAARCTNMMIVTLSIGDSKAKSLLDASPNIVKSKNAMELWRELQGQENKERNARAKKQ